MLGRLHWTTLMLAALLLLVQADLWWGKGNVRHVMSLQKDLSVQRGANTVAADRNGRLQAEVLDLKDGEEMVEEKARAELGMIKSDEILVQFAARR